MLNEKTAIIRELDIAANPRQHKRLASLKLRPGHRMFKYHEGEISAVTDDEYEDNLTIGQSGRKLIVTEGAIYTTALNRKNALKKWLRSGVLKYDPK